jgi:hypothetical protein
MLQHALVVESSAVVAAPTSTSANLSGSLAGGVGANAVGSGNGVCGVDVEVLKPYVCPMEGCGKRFKNKNGLGMFFGFFGFVFFVFESSQKICFRYGLLTRVFLFFCFL